MKINSLYPVIGTRNIETAKSFYTQTLDFKVTYDSDWYVSLVTGHNPAFELALLDYSHPSVPEKYQQPAQGVLINIEVADVDAEYDRLVSRGGDIILPIRSEEWGQRHFIIADPDGILLDIIQVIEPSEEYASQYK